MTSKGVILHGLRTPDWLTIKLQPNEVAAASLAAILLNLDRIEEQAFAVRGEAMLLIEERNLYRWIVDEEVGDYYVSFDKWLKDTLPRSWGYCRDALRVRKDCRQIPYGEFVQVKRCNLEQLRKVSSSVRILPEVVEAAKQMPEKAFVDRLNSTYNQHLEAKQPIIMADSSIGAIVDQAIAMAIALEGCTSRSNALECVAAFFVTGCQAAYEKLLKETA